MRNQVIIDKMSLLAFMFLCTFGHSSDGFLSYEYDFIFHKICCIFYINLSIINNNITHKESAHPLGNGFSQALESRFLVPKNEACAVCLIPSHRPFFLRYGQS